MADDMASRYQVMEELGSEYPSQIFDCQTLHVRGMC
jgi:hypothetical protein